MILIFDFFETIVHNKSMDFNRGLKVMWEKYYKDKCSFEEIATYGEELFGHMLSLHKEGKEYAFVKEELPQYAAKFGGEVVQMEPCEEAEFLMRCNEMETMPDIPEALHEFSKLDIPMYVLSNSGVTAEALSIVLERLGIRQYFRQIWSSADYGRLKPDRGFFEMAIATILAETPDANRKDIVFIGDSYDTDVVGAVQTGLNVIWLNHKRDENTNNLPVHCIYGTSELEKKVKEL